MGNSKFATQLLWRCGKSGAYNLFIYGASTGQSHLLRCLHRNRQDFRKQIFVKGEEFTNELINAISEQTTKAFHEKYRSADVLHMDDVQFIGGKESTQEEFFHTFNSLYQEGKQIILTSDRPPKEIKTLEERLRTRFEWGLLADVQPPDFETRTAIIHRKAEQIGIEVPTEVAEYIANRLKTNIRQLEGAVKKLKAYKMLQTPPSIMVYKTCSGHSQRQSAGSVTIDHIISRWAEPLAYPADIRSNNTMPIFLRGRSASVVRKSPKSPCRPLERNLAEETIPPWFTPQQVEKYGQRPSLQGNGEDIIEISAPTSGATFPFNIPPFSIVNRFCFC